MSFAILGQVSPDEAGGSVVPSPPPPAPARAKRRWERAVPAGHLQAGVLSPGELLGLSLQMNRDQNTALLFRTWLSDEGKGSHGSQCGVSRRSCTRAKG